MNTNVPQLNDRAQGWLNFLYLKATTPDDWSEKGTPHEWWDKTSTAPMCSFPRFDLQESTYAIGLMADSCLLYTSPSPRDGRISRMPSSA